MFCPEAVNLRAVACRDESVYVIVFHILQEVGELVGGEQSLYLHLVVLVIPAFDGVERAAANVVGNDMTAYSWMKSKTWRSDLSILSFPWLRR